VRDKTKQENEDDEARKIIGESGASKRMSDFNSTKLKIFYSCAAPDGISNLRNGIYVIYCKKCKLVIPPQ
jgi:hypothetical protein